MLKRALMTTEVKMSQRESRVRSKRQKPQLLWPAQSIVLTLNRDDLPEVVNSISNVQDVHINRNLKTPTYIETKQLPQSILDNKASAWGLQAINALAAWGAYGATGVGAKVAVLDTGIDVSHPDLAGKIGGWAEFNANGSMVVGSTPRDTDQHGTHVAGTIAGGDASGRWIGVAPEARIWAGLVLDGNIGGTDAQVLAGMQWAIDQGVDVINMSLGGLTLGPEVPSTYTQSVVNSLLAGTPVVGAIGNEGNQTSGLPGNEMFTFSVGATDHRDFPAGFSGGRTHILTDSAFIDPADLPLPYSKPNVSAPGVGVLSSVPGNDWAAFNGTSMATPHVAGAIALLVSMLDLTMEDGQDRAFLLQDLLTSTVEELGESGHDHRFGLGRIDVLRAFGYAEELGLLA